MTVRELLTASRAAHQQYRAAIPHMRMNAATRKPEPVRGDAGLAMEKMAEAYQLRLDAEALDPQQTDQAWADEVGSNFKHRTVMEWYRSQLFPENVTRAESQ